MWRCRCSCGKEVLVSGPDLRRRDGKGARACAECGRTKHGHARGGQSPEYRCWHSMIQRCLRHPRYHARGIRVCGRWQSSFEEFLADMGPMPGPGLTIDRIDNDGDYEPGNCRWATRKQQANNTSRNRRIEIDGETRTLTEWLDHFGMNVQTYFHRIWAGWDPIRAIREPADPHRPKSPEHREQIRANARRAFSPEQAAEARRKVESGQSMSSVAREAGVSASTIARVCGRNY